jgi:hypothetical protein
LNSFGIDDDSVLTVRLVEARDLAGGKVDAYASFLFGDK